MTHRKLLFGAGAAVAIILSGIALIISRPGTSPNNGPILPRPTMPSDAPPICKFAYNGNRGEVKRLLENKTNLEEHGSDGRTALFWAAAAGNLEITDLLLRAGASANTTDDGQGSPLIWAAIKGNPGVVRLLLQYGANVNQQDKMGATPLIEAAMLGHSEVARILIANKGDPNIRDQYGFSAIDWATKNNHEQVVRILQMR